MARPPRIVKRSAAREAPAWPVQVPVRAWMTAPVLTVTVETRVGEAAALMRARQVRHLPVVDGGRLVGIVTDRDLRQVVFDPGLPGGPGAGAGDVAGLPVREVMTWGVITVRPSTDLREAARLMHEQKIGAVPVVARGRVVGILTEHDVLRALDELLRRQVVTVRPLAAVPAGERDYDYGFPLPAEAARATEAEGGSNA